jgi:hypothetical protein
MFEITLKISNFSNIFSHAKIKIFDLTTEKTYVVSFSKKQYRGFNSVFNDEEENILFYQPKVVKLYSDIPKAYDEFIKDYESQFGIKKEKTFFIAGKSRTMQVGRSKNFHSLYHNCADACNYTLNYFFPVAENLEIEKAWQKYKKSTYLLGFITCGLLPFFGAPPSISAPLDVLKKGQLLEAKYGAHVLQSKDFLIKKR